MTRATKGHTWDLEDYMRNHPEMVRQCIICHENFVPRLMWKGSGRNRKTCSPECHEINQKQLRAKAMRKYHATHEKEANEARLRYSYVKYCKKHDLPIWHPDNNEPEKTGIEVDA